LVLTVGFASALLSLPMGGAHAQAPAPAWRPKTSGISFSAGSWIFTVGGRIKLDLIHDFDAIGSTDFFDPRTIPTDGSRGQNTEIDARATRLSLGIVGPVEGRDLKLFVEGDFDGASSGFRLRHAYGQYGWLLAGQTWTTFMDEDNIPSTIDQETPLAAPHVRQGLLRLSAAVSKRSQVAFGIEESDPEVVPPPGVAGKVENIMPDLTARFRINEGRGHVQLSGFVGRTRFRPTVGDPTDVTIGAVLLSARFRPVGSDAAYAQVAYGPGLGRYRGAVSASADASGRLRAVESLGLTADTSATGRHAGHPTSWRARSGSSATWATQRARTTDSTI
jgi:hypothetical protein